jgi:hypothetical protein
MKINIYWNQKMTNGITTSEDRKKLARIEAGKAGALALNSDPEKKSKAAKKAAATRKRWNPEVFREMGKLAAGISKKRAGK